MGGETLTLSGLVSTQMFLFIVMFLIFVAMGYDILKPSTGQKLDGQNVWVDDVRKEPNDWVRCYNAEEAIELLQEAHETGQRINVLSLDHDMGDGKTGYDVLKWIEENTVLDDSYMPPQRILVHSDNAGARPMMSLAVESIKRKFDMRQNNV
jgi:hypothetical protein